MSELLDGVPVPRPTVSSLYYLLGNLSHSWESIAGKLGISSDQVERIERDRANCNTRMIEAFDVWLSADVDCNWDKVIKVLNTMDESLAEKVHHYIREVGKIEHSWQSRGFHCDWIKPLKNLGYNRWWLEETFCQDDVLAHSSIEDYKAMVLRYLSACASKWYEIGIALKISKSKLDHIQDNINADRQLSNMIEIAIKEEITLRKLINVLLEEGLATAADGIKREAMPYDVPPLLKKEFPYKKSDFSSKWRPDQKPDQTKKYYSQLREILKIDAECNDEDIWGNFDKHISAKSAKSDMNIEDRKEILEVCNKIIELDKKYAKEIKINIEKFKKNLDKARESVIKLTEQKDTLERSKAALNKDKENISKSIEALSNVQTDEEKSHLLKLESKRKNIEEKLQEVCTELDDCIHKLQLANADYDSIRLKLNVCIYELEQLEMTIGRCEKFILNQLEKAQKEQSTKLPTDKLRGELAELREEICQSPTCSICKEDIERIKCIEKQLKDIEELDEHVENIKMNLKRTRENISEVNAAIKTTKGIILNQQF